MGLVKLELMLTGTRLTGGAGMGCSRGAPPGGLDAAVQEYGCFLAPPGALETKAIPAGAGMLVARFPDVSSCRATVRGESLEGFTAFAEAAASVGRLS
jgi:hypothetical protein